MRKARLRCSRRWCAMSSASACWEASPRARASCSAATPVCSASTAASCATSSRPTTRICPRPLRASPTSMPRTPARSSARLEREDSCFLLHLSEGVTQSGQADSIARRHFLALEVAPDEWAINDRFAGIHAAGLLPEDFDVLAQRGGSMVWSPLSNLLLYGDTARVDAAKRAGVRIGLGSDWSPSGSKNLLGELKVAWLYSQHVLDGLFSARDIVSMATREAAAILKWEDALGHARARQTRRSARDRGDQGRSVRGAHPGERDRDPAGHDQRHRALRHAWMMKALGSRRGDAPGRGKIAPAVPRAADRRPGRGQRVAPRGAHGAASGASAIYPSSRASWRSRRSSSGPHSMRPNRSSGRWRSTRSSRPGSTNARACRSTARVISPGPRSRRRAPRRRCRRFFSRSSSTRSPSPTTGTSLSRSRTSRTYPRRYVTGLAKLY